jgi:two-component system, OmpR family, sensor histidine kinase QseC
VKPRSIHTLLIAGTAAVLVAVLGAAAWIGFDAGQDEAAELFDARLATSARVLAALVTTQAAAARDSPALVVSFPAPLESALHDEATALGHHYETKIAFQVLDGSGRLLLRSASAPETPYAALSAGFSTPIIGGRSWRVFTLASADLWIQAAERDDVRAEMAAKLALATVAPLIVGTVLLLFLLSLLIRYALRPLAELARRIERREPESLAPIELPRTTAETASVLKALNGLLARVQAALERERRFTADAAHELRTPLSALKVHSQNAVRAASEEERRASLERMLAGLERSIRLAEQMLAYSRAVAPQAPLAREMVELRDVVDEAIQDVLPRLKQRGQRLALASEPPLADLPIWGERDKLVALVRNLLDNAARYAPEGSTVRLDLRAGPEGATLSVSDAGPGIPQALRERVFESYYRIPGSRGDGSGLGLAIVREIALQHGATIEIGEGDGGSGTRFTVRFAVFPVAEAVPGGAPRSRDATG